LSGQATVAQAGTVFGSQAITGSIMVVEQGDVTRVLYLSGAQLDVIPGSIVTEIAVALNGQQIDVIADTVGAPKFIELSGQAITILMGIPAVNINTFGLREEPQRIVYVSYRSTRVEVNKQYTTTYVPHTTDTIQTKERENTIWVAAE
jgi:hypothetical protein